METRAGWRFWFPKTLPSVIGPLWRPFILLWSGILACCLWAAALSLPYIYHAAIAPESPVAAAGFTIDPNQPWPTVGLLVGPKTRAGFRKGDRLIAIAGKPVGATYPELYQQLAGRAGTSITITARETSGVVVSRVVIRDPNRFRRALGAVGLTPFASKLVYSIIPILLEVMLAIGCAIILMIQRARDPLAPWASLMMLWTVLSSAMGQQIFGEQFLDSQQVYIVTLSIANAMLVVVLAVFPEGRFEPRWTLGVAALGIILQPILAMSSLTNAGKNVVLVLLQFGAVAAIAVRFVRMPPGTGRQQIRWALLGFAASTASLAAFALVQFAIDATSDVGLVAWLYIGMNILGSATTTLLIVGITVSLLRYRLYDADATISRSVVYSALTLSLLAIFAGSEKVIEIMGEEYFGERLGALAGGLGAAVAAVCIGPVHHRVTHWAEHRFRSGLVRLRDGLPLLVGDMRETATPIALADAMLARVEKGVRARHGAVVVGGKVLDVRDIDEASVVEWLELGAAPVERLHQIQTDRADPLFPIRVPLHADGVGLVGWLLLGPRPDGSLYGREERAALHAIADPVARALAIAIKREEQEAARRVKDDARDRELDRLARLVDRHHAQLGFGVSSSEASA